MTGSVLKQRTATRAMIVALALMLSACDAAGQPAASRSVNARRLPLQTDTFAVFVIQRDDTVRAGTLVDRLWTDGDRLIRLYDQNDRITGRQRDSIVSRMADLSPVAYHSTSVQRIAHLTFLPGAVNGWTRLPNGDSVDVSVDLAAGVYDGTSYDLIVRASDLRDGFTLSIHAFVLGPNAVSRIDGRVTGSTAVGERDCWVFAANFAGMPVTFWIDKETRALRRQLLQFSVNTSMLFELPAKLPPPRRST